MELTEVLERRHSVRKYTEQEVPEDVVREIVGLASTAPSAGAIRGYKVIGTKKPPITSVKAPWYLVVCCKPEAYAKRYGERGKTLYALQDATIVAAYIQLIAVDRGLATVWVGAFSERAVSALLELPENVRPIAVLPLGYEAKDD